MACAHSVSQFSYTNHAVYAEIDESAPTEVLKSHYED